LPIEQREIFSVGVCCAEAGTICPGQQIIQPGNAGDGKMNQQFAAKRMHRSSGLLLIAVSAVGVRPAIGRAQVAFHNSWSSNGIPFPFGVAVSGSGNVDVHFQERKNENGSAIHKSTQAK
jgi:hypothetical protein